MRFKYKKMKKIYSILLVFLLASGFVGVAQTTSFLYTGSIQYFTVPSGVTTIGVVARGAMGGYNSTMWSTTCSGTLPDSPGRGACVQATLAVTPGQVLTIYVGQKGTDGFNTGCAATPGTGGWNGGGNGGFGYGSYGGGGGGGASDVRFGAATLADRVVVAAGGGGAGGNYYGIVNAERGGHGGTLTGEDGYGDLVAFANGGAQGGGPGSGGAPGTYPSWASGSPGGFGVGGNAGTGVAFSGSGGGGGGAGYWGGGGGSWGGGGGGSSYTSPAYCTFVSHTRGCNGPLTPGPGAIGDGSVDICLTDPGLISGSHPICAGLTLPLKETIGGGVWSSSNTLVATVDATGLVTSVTGGTATITYTVASACATVYATTLFKVIPSPAPITGVNPVCVGGSYTFTDATPGGRWSLTGLSSATIGSTTGIVTGIYPGTAIITYTEPVAGCTTSTMVSINGIAGVTNVCNGLSVPLTYLTGPGVWSSSNPAVATIGSSSGIVTGMSIGTTTISYSNAVCPESILMNVNPIAPDAGPDSICVKATAYVTNIIGGGVWSSSDVTVAKVTAVPGLVTGISAGTAVLSYITPTGCLSQKMVTIIAAPPAIAGYTQVCPGGNTSLSDPLAGGVWSSLDPAVASVNPSSGVVLGITADTTSILYTIRPGCSSSTMLIVNPTPFPILGADTLCPGSVDTLHNASIGGLWSTTTPLLDTVVDSTGRITARISGTAVIHYTLPTGCTRSRNVYIRPIPTPHITYNAITNSFEAPLGYPHYQWYDSISGLVPHATSPTLAATTTQWYFVVVTDTNGCISPSNVIEFNIARLGVNGMGSSKVRIYPNPTSGVLFIESPVRVRAVISGMDGKVEIDVADAKQIDLTRLANAVYMLSVYDDEGHVIGTQKLIKE